MNDLSEAQLDKLIDLARRDDWQQHFVSSDLRQMLGEIKRLRREEKHLRDMVQAYSDMAKQR